jgi:hypothetical protein
MDLNRLDASNWTREIESAKLEFLNIDNKYNNPSTGLPAEEDDILNVNLIDLMGNSITGDANAFVPQFQEGGGNYFGTTYSGYEATIKGWTSTSFIESWTDKLDNQAVGETVTMDFSQTVIDAMNTYKKDNGWIGIGIDPDCHYTKSGIKLTINYKTTSVPEPSSIGLLLIGLTMVGGMAFHRKKRS